MSQSKQANAPREPKKARLFYIRKAKDLNQMDFAEKVGIHYVTLSRLENYRIVPSHELAEEIGRVTGQSAGQVIDDYLKHRRTA